MRPRISCFSRNAVVFLFPYIIILLLMDMRAHIVAAGLVQGVGYRWFVAHHARRLGLAGFVCNLRDGTVEIDVEGERSLVEDLIRELKNGPRSAQVTDLRIEWQPPSPAGRSTSEQFEIR